MSYEQEYRQAKRAGNVRKVRAMRERTHTFIAQDDDGNPMEVTTLASMSEVTPHHPETLGEPSHPEHAE